MFCNNYQNTYTCPYSVIFILQINWSPLEGKGGSPGDNERDTEWRGGTK